MDAENPYQSPRALQRRRIRRRASIVGVAVVWTSVCFFATVDLSGLTGKEPTASFTKYSDAFPTSAIPWGWLVVLTASLLWVAGLVVIRLLSARR